jgi:nucleoside-diphosphate-sugar epimerase
MNNHNRSALITGATGFIGKHLTTKMVSDDWDIHIIVRKNSDLDVIDSVRNKLTIHEYDGTVNSTMRIFHSVKPIIVFHLASKFLSSHEGKDIEDLIRSNITFGSHILEATVSNGCFSLINTGTSWQHFTDAVYNPVNLYAATKQAFEDIILFYTESTELKAINLKLFDTYGPDDSRKKLIPLLKKTISTNDKLIMSPGEQLIDLVYIDDVVHAYLKAAEILLSGKCLKNETYGVSSEQPVSIKKLVELIERLTDHKFNISWGERNYREREVMIPWNNFNKLPGWKPEISLIEGLTREFK